MMIVLRQVWDWLRRWGGWIAGPLGAALFLLWRRRSVAAPLDLTLKNKVEAETTKAEDVAKEVAVQEKLEATEAHTKETTELLDKELEDVPAIETDQGKLNEFLLQQGKQIRRKPNE